MILKEDFNIRKATGADTLDILKIRHQGWLSGYGKILGEKYIDDFFLSEKENEEKIKKDTEYYNSDLHNYYIIEYKKEKVGLYAFEDKMRRENDDCYIWGFYILPEYQHLGLGTLAFEHMTKNLKKQGYTKFHLITPKENIKGNNFYRKHHGHIAKEYVESMLKNDETLVCEYSFEL